MRNQGVPVIRLTVEGMQYSILHVLNEHLMAQGDELAEQVKTFCTPGTIARIVGESVEREIKAAIDREIRDFYAYGAGRDAIKNAVIARLEEKTAA